MRSKHAKSSWQPMSDQLSWMRHAPAVHHYAFPGSAQVIFQTVCHCVWQATSGHIPGSETGMSRDSVKPSRIGNRANYPGFQIL